MSHLKHLTFDEGASSATKMVFEITVQTGRRFGEVFHEILRTRNDLAGLRPVLNGSRLSIDATNIPGAADAFDSLVGKVKDIVEHDNQLETEKRKIDQTSKKEAVERFKTSQGLPD